MQTLLLSRPDRVGDVLIATACLEPIRRQQPDWKIVFAAREIMRPLLEGHPMVDQYIALPSPGIGSRQRAVQAALGHGDLVEKVRAVGADTVVHLHPDAVCQLACRAAGVARRMGYRHRFLLDHWTLTDPYTDPRRAGTRHESQYNFDLLKPLGIVPPSVESLCPSIHLADCWQESLHAKMMAAGWNPDEGGAGDYLVINPTAYSLPLRWPPEHFAALARALHGEFARVIMVAERADDPSVLEIRQQLPPAGTANGNPWFIDLSGQTNLAELGWLLRGARLLVSRNTGTAHLASAVGCPLVELFGRLEGIYGPGRWRALGGKTRVVTAATADLVRKRGESKQAHWHRCHAAIPLEAVLRSARELLASAR